MDLDVGEGHNLICKISAPILTMEYCSAIKRNEELINAMWMNLENTMLGERSTDPPTYTGRRFLEA